MSKRIIIVGPAASGKDFLKKKFGERGFKLDVSYTDREPREGEVEGKDYYFFPTDHFQVKINLKGFYEWVQHGKYRYGTGSWEWDNMDVFIMETEGLKQLSKEERQNCFVIYLNPSRTVRQARMKEERGWSHDKIMGRTVTDHSKFNGFTDYDMMITNPDF